jgi:hypothetical protein
VGEGLARWASNGTIGSEFTGLYFDFRNPNRAYVNIQHPASGVDPADRDFGRATFGAGEQANPPVAGATCRKRGKWLRNLVL